MNECTKCSSLVDQKYNVSNDKFYGFLIADTANDRVLVLWLVVKLSISNK